MSRKESGFQSPPCWKGNVLLMPSWVCSSEILPPWVAALRGRETVLSRAFLCYWQTISALGVPTDEQLSHSLIFFLPSGGWEGGCWEGRGLWQWQEHGLPDPPAEVSEGLLLSKGHSLKSSSKMNWLLSCWYFRLKEFPRGRNEVFEFRRRFECGYCVLCPMWQWLA